MTQVTGIKSWFLKKEGYSDTYIESMNNKNINVKKETEKAILIDWTDISNVNGYEHRAHFEMWVPKSVLQDRFDKATSHLAYHSYLLDVYYEAYDKQLIPNHTFKSGYNQYNGKSFAHQKTTKELLERFEQLNVPYMTYEDWKRR